MVSGVAGSARAMSVITNALTSRNKTNKQRAYALEGEMLRGRRTCRFTIVGAGLSRYGFRRCIRDRTERTCRRSLILPAVPRLAIALLMLGRSWQLIPR